MKKAPPTTNGAGFQSFYDKWVEELTFQAIKRQTGTKSDRFWEGSEAYISLSKADALCVVMPTTEDGNGFAKRTLRGLYREIEIYKHNRNQIVKVNEEFKKAIHKLEQASGRISSISQSVPMITATRDRCITFLKHELELLNRHADGYWKDALLALPEERGKWNLEVTGKVGDPLKYVLPDEVATWEEKVTKSLTSPKLQRNIDLDTCFQIRIARALQSFFMEIPRFDLRTGRQLRVDLTTVSRLVVLTYIAAGISVEKDNKLFVSDNLRALTVGLVYLKLGHAGLKKS